MHSNPDASAPPKNFGYFLATGTLRLLSFIDQPALPKERRRGGVALLMVLMYIALMSALVVSNFYTNQVNFSIAINGRDGLKAHYKALSALNLARVILAYQDDLKRKDPQLAAQMRKSGFQVHQITDLLLEPFKTGAVTLIGSEGERVASYNFNDDKGGEDGREDGSSGLGDDQGNYTVQITPEEGRINLNRFSKKKDKIALFNLCLLFSPQQYDGIFNEGDPEGIKASRLETLSAIIDWVDKDNERTGISAMCEFEGSSGDEDSRYDNSSSKRHNYQNKNAPFTTLDELFLVHGVSDDFMEAFRESFTVYPVNKINVNVASARVIYAVLCDAVKLSGFNVQSEDTWACNNPQISEKLLLLALAVEGYQHFVNTPLLLLSYYLQGNPQVIEGVSPRGTVVPFRKPKEFIDVLKAIAGDPLHIQLQRFFPNAPTAYQLFPNPALLDLSAIDLSIIGFDERKIRKAITTDGPKIFRIVADGEYNGTHKSLTAVIDFSTPGGKFLYWSEY